jgi:hypothetical protein
MRQATIIGLVLAFSFHRADAAEARSIQLEPLELTPATLTMTGDIRGRRSDRFAITITTGRRCPASYRRAIRAKLVFAHGRLGRRRMHFVGEAERRSLGSDEGRVCYLVENRARTQRRRKHQDFRFGP